MPNLAKSKYERFLVYASRRSPVYITERAGVDLRNYSVRVLLDDSWDGWSVVRPDGSDIFFADEFGNPLYFYPLIWDYSSRKALFYVMVPVIPRKSTIEINLMFGGKSPPSSFRDPNKALLYFDDFRFRYSNSGTTGTKKIDLPDPKVYLYVYDPGGYNDAQWSITVDGDVAEVTIKDAETGDLSEIASLVSTDVFSGDICLEARASFPDWEGAGSSSWYRAFELGLDNRPEIGDTGDDAVALGLSETGVVLADMVNGTQHTTSDLDVITPSDTDGFLVFRIGNIPSLGKSVLYFSRDGISFTKLGEQGYAVTDPMHAAIVAAAWTGYGPWRILIDWWLVRHYIEPEPSVEIEPSRSVFRDADLT